MSRLPWWLRALVWALWVGLLVGMFSVGMVSPLILLQFLGWLG